MANVWCRGEITGLRVKGIEVYFSLKTSEQVTNENGDLLNCFKEINTDTCYLIKTDKIFRTYSTYFPVLTSSLNETIKIFFSQFDSGNTLNAKVEEIIIGDFN